MLFYLFFPAGGIGKYTHQLLEELVGNEHLDIEVVCLPDFQWRENKSYRTWPHLYDISHRWKPLRKLRFLLAQFINPWRLLKRAQKVDADIIHICNINYLSFPFWRRALDNWGGRLVCTAHDIRRQSPIINRRFEEKQLKAIYRRCDAVLVHSAQQVEELRDFAGVEATRVHVVPHGPSVYAAPPVDSQTDLKARYGLAPKAQVALFFGFLRPEKNLAGLISALHQAQQPALHLYVAGNTPPRAGAYVDECLALVRSLGLEDRITFDIRYIPDEELPVLLKLCDWVALPYRESFTSQSGVLNLAAFYQRPVLATPTAGMLELLEDVAIGEVCTGFKDAEIATGIHKISTEIERGKEWGFARYSDRYSWSRNADCTGAVYGRLMEQAA